MSFDALRWALAQDSTNLTSSQLWLLARLADHHNTDTGLCCPTARQLEQSTGMRNETITAALRALAEKGYISIRTGKHRNYHYILHFDQGNQPAKAQKTQNKPSPPVHLPTAGAAEVLADPWGKNQCPGNPGHGVPEIRDMVSRKSGTKPVTNQKLTLSPSGRRFTAPGEKGSNNPKTTKRTTLAEDLNNTSWADNWQPRTH